MIGLIAAWTARGVSVIVVAGQIAGVGRPRGAQGSGSGAGRERIVAALEALGGPADGREPDVATASGSVNLHSG